MGVPSRVLSNQELSQIVDTSDEWIRTRTGIQERRIIDPSLGESNSSLSILSSKNALVSAKMAPDEIDLVICCTATPDTWMPITAARVIAGLGIKNCASFDLNAACSGYLTGLHVADSLIRSGAHKNILVIGADVFSSILDWTDRKTCVLFGDGAGAAVLSRVENANPETDSMILCSQLYTLPDTNEFLAIKSGGVGRTPFENPIDSVSDSGNACDARPYVTMNGGEVFKAGSRGMAEAAKNLMATAKVDPSQIRWLVPHQANLRIIEMVAKLADFPMEKVYTNVDRWGNTSAATVAIALAEMSEKNLVQKGDLILLDVFGGGFTYGAMLLRW